MKKLAAAVFLTAFTISFGQNISDYKYIYVSKDLDKKINDYQLDKILATSLKTKKYVVIQDKMENWPTELRDNKCQVLKANILDDSSFLKNKIKVVYKDCNEKTILEAKGASSEKDYELGYPEALKESLMKVPMSNPKETIAITPVTEKPIEQIIEKDTPKSTSTQASVFTNGKETFQRIDIGNGQFILVNPNSSTPYATFKESTKKIAYHVKLQNGETTLGYLENGNIILEIPQSNDTYKKEVFQPK